MTPLVAVQVRSGSPLKPWMATMLHEVSFNLQNSCDAVAEGGGGGGGTRLQYLLD